MNVKKAATKKVGQSVDAILEFVDVDGIARKIDVNHVLERIDVNAVLDRVDIDRLLERTDANRHLERVDVNAVLSRVDVNSLLKRSDLGPLIAKSSTGIFTQLLDQIRIQIALIDQVLHSIAQSKGRFRRTRKWYSELPPAPGTATGTTAPPYPRGTPNRAVALQGRAAGAVSRALAGWLDNILVALIFSIGLKIIDLMWVNLILRMKDDFSVSEHYHDNKSAWFYSFAFSVWWFLYHFILVALTGRTIGQAIFGLLVAGADGCSVQPLEVAIRTPLMPFTFTVGIFVGLVRKDRRVLHDLLSGTAVVYSWDATAADLRNRELTDMERIVPMFDDDDERSITSTKATTVIRNTSTPITSSRSSSTATSAGMEVIYGSRIAEEAVSSKDD